MLGSSRYYFCHITITDGHYVALESSCEVRHQGARYIVYGDSDAQLTAEGGHTGALCTKLG